MGGIVTERLDAGRDVGRAAAIVRGGGAVAFPTETVYGLGANALSASAVEKIFVAKGRPHWDPLIVHVCDEAMLGRVVAAGSVGRVSRELMERFWPGPLTLLLVRGEEVPDAVTAGRRLVGVRMPGHPVALELIRRAGVPVAAPSANRFGRTSPTTAAHVLEDLDGRIDAVLDGGACAVGVESTVVEVVWDQYRGKHRACVYRPGGVSLDQLSYVAGLGSAYFYKEKVLGGEVPASLPSPGLGIRHYAPKARLQLVEDNAERTRMPVERWLVEPIDFARAEAGIVGVMLPDGWDRSSAQLVFRWGRWDDEAALAKNLFAGLRELDEHEATTIICPVPAGSGIGEAIRDRLRKAAQPS